MDKEYEIIEHIADIGLKIFGDTQQKLFQNAARGMFFLITGCPVFRKQKRKQYRKVECKAFNTEELLVGWLNELLYIHSTDFMVFDDFEIKRLTGNVIQAEIWGVKIKDSPYHIEKEIKAVTYHNLQVIKNEKGYWEATIIFDI